MGYLVRLALIIGGAALFAGCGGSASPPIGTPGALSQGRAIAQYTNQGGSWMLPEAKSGDLLYASNTQTATDNVIVLSFPKGKLVGQVMLPYGTPSGLCSDTAGNVWVTAPGSVSQSFIYEYAHGGTSPIATLSDPGFASGCAVDPASGNLAVTNYFTDDPPYNHGDVAVYQGGAGTPVTYSDPNLPFFNYCTYDDEGNLFVTVDGLFAELPVGGGALETIILNKSISPLSVQWDTVRGNLVVSDSQGGPRQPAEIYQVGVSGSSGIVSGPTTLQTPHNRIPGPQFFIQGGKIVGPAQKGEDLDFWRYPDGGKPTKVIHRPGGAVLLNGVTVSVAPSH